MNALVAYNDGQYDAVVDLMKPLRYDILRIGGSNAQVLILTSYLFYYKRIFIIFIIFGVNFHHIYKTYSSIVFHS